MATTTATAIQSTSVLVSREEHRALEAYVSAEKDYPTFDLDGHETIGYCCDVYDGDTCKVVFALRDNRQVFYKWTLRLTGYDAPELKGPTKALGTLARDTLRGLILHKYIFVKCHGADKYGRLLATLYILDYNPGNGYSIPSQSVNDYILNNTEGSYAYEGGTKRTTEDILSTS